MTYEERILKINLLVEKASNPRMDFDVFVKESMDLIYELYGSGSTQYFNIVSLEREYKVDRILRNTEQLIQKHGNKLLQYLVGLKEKAERDQELTLDKQLKDATNQQKIMSKEIKAPARIRSYRQSLRKFFTVLTKATTLSIIGGLITAAYFIGRALERATFDNDKNRLDKENQILVSDTTRKAYTIDSLSKIITTKKVVDTIKK